MKDYFEFQTPGPGLARELLWDCFGMTDNSILVFSDDLGFGGMSREVRRIYAGMSFPEHPPPRSYELAKTISELHGFARWGVVVGALVIRPSTTFHDMLRIPFGASYDYVYLGSEISHRAFRASFPGSILGDLRAGGIVTTFVSPCGQWGAQLPIHLVAKEPSFNHRVRDPKPSEGYPKDFFEPFRGVRLIGKEAEFPATYLKEVGYGVCMHGDIVVTRLEFDWMVGDDKIIKRRLLSINAIHPIGAKATKELFDRCRIWARASTVKRLVDQLKDAIRYENHGHWRNWQAVIRAEYDPFTFEFGDFKLRHCFEVEPHLR